MSSSTVKIRAVNCWLLMPSEPFRTDPFAWVRSDSFTTDPRSSIEVVKLLLIQWILSVLTVVTLDRNYDKEEQLSISSQSFSLMNHIVAVSCFCLLMLFFGKSFSFFI